MIARTICKDIAELRSVRSLVIASAVFEYQGFYRRSDGAWTVVFTCVVPASETDDDLAEYGDEKMIVARHYCTKLGYSLEETDGHYIVVDEKRGQRHGYAMDDAGISLMISDLEDDIKEDKENEESKESSLWRDELEDDFSNSRGVR